MRLSTQQKRYICDTLCESLWKQESERIQELVPILDSYLLEGYPEELIPLLPKYSLFSGWATLREVVDLGGLINGQTYFRFVQSSYISPRWIRDFKTGECEFTDRLIERFKTDSRVIEILRYEHPIITKGKILCILKTITSMNQLEKRFPEAYEVLKAYKPPQEDSLIMANETPSTIINQIRSVLNSENHT